MSTSGDGRQVRGYTASMTRRAVEHFPCAPASVGAARRFCAAALDDLLGAGAVDIRDDAEMIISELVTNAVNAHSRHIELCVERFDTLVRLEVIDDGDGLPQPRQPDADSRSGRGLLIVSALSRRWGVDPGPAGKRVWAELPVEPVPA